MELGRNPATVLDLQPKKGSLGLPTRLSSCARLRISTRETH